MLPALREYARLQGASAEVLAWVDTTLVAHLRRAQPTQAEVEHVLDYLISPEAPTRLKRASYLQMQRAAATWSAVQQRRGQQVVEGALDVEAAFSSGEYRVVKLLSKASYLREGMLMRHCLGGYTPTKDVTIYSVRDATNQPHATLEVRSDAAGVLQIKGKGNGSIHPRYVDVVLDFLDYLKLPVRPAEMRNLGYYQLTPAYLELAALFTDTRGKGLQLVSLRGVQYAYA